MSRIAPLLVLSLLAAAPSAQTYLKASNTGAGDHFAYSVAASGDTVAVGAIDEASSTKLIGGDQSNNSAPGAGAVYVFVHGGVWFQQAYVKPANTDAADKFGWSVGLSGDTLVVGAQGEDSGATGVNGNGFDNSSASSGAAYVFVRNGGSWSQQAYLKASNTDTPDNFGHAVAVDGDTLVVGAQLEDGAIGGVNGDQANNGAQDAGAAYVFVRSGGVWTQQAYLKAAQPGVHDYFGWSVAISGDTIVVSAPGEDGNSTGVNGDETSNGATDSGAAYVFVRNGTTWTQQAYLKASNNEIADGFGQAVSISGDTIVVGANQEDSPSTGVNGSGLLDSAPSSGAAYVFVRNGTSWSQQAYLKASNTQTLDQFGYSVAASGDRIVVGATGESSNATGVNGNQADNSLATAGAAYAFVRNGTTWTQQAYLKAANTGLNDTFGFSSAVSGDTVVCGAIWEDSNATGVDGDGTNNIANDSGAAYAYTLPPIDAWTNLGSGLAGVAGVPSLAGSGTLAAGSSDSIVLAGAKPSAPATLFVALSSTPTPFKGGTLLPVPALLLVFAATDATGAIPFPFVMPAGVPAGTPLYLQWAIQDPAAVKGVALSNAIRGLTP